MLLAKAMLFLTLEMIAFGAFMFLAAGTMHWVGAWAWLLLMLVLGGIVTASIARSDPDLLKERMKPIVQKSQKTWDKVVMSTFMVVMILWMPFMGLDAVRFGWSKMNPWLQALGGVAIFFTFYVSYLTFNANSFLANVARIQADRSQSVVTSGPYAHVRHPLYAGVLAFLPGTALLLGSYYGLIWAAALIALLVVRAALEDRMLRDELEGYAEYAERVRYRLLPGVW